MDICYEIVTLLHFQIEDQYFTMKQNALKHIFRKRYNTGYWWILPIDELHPTLTFIGLVETKAVGCEHDNRNIEAE